MYSNKIFGACEKDYIALYGKDLASIQMRIDSRIDQKILGRTWLAPTRLLKPFTLKKHQDASA
jgi:hypothetical protein